MKITFKNLGIVREADIEIGNLTVLCGENNTGKTYVTYGVWGVFYPEKPGTSGIGTSISSAYSNHLGKHQIELWQTQKSILDVEILKKELLSFARQKLYLSTGMLNKIFNTNEPIFISTSINISSIEDLFINFYHKKINDFVFIFENYRRSNHFEIHKNPNSYKVEVKTMHKIENLNFNLDSTYWLTHIIPNTFLLTAQRDSIELFYKSVDKANSAAIRNWQVSQNVDELNNLSRFALPIQHNINFARELPINSSSFLAKEHPELVNEIENLLGVKYIYNSQTSNHSIEINGKEIAAHLASTSVRALMHLHYWLKHSAQKGDLLMIDEPELNLHPKNQIKMARLFAKLVNVGIRVWITTHSDYIVKEFNNLIMLGNVENIDQTLENLNLNRDKNDHYKTNEILKADDVRAYIAKIQEDNMAVVERVEIDKYGLVHTTFDSSINEIVDVANTIADFIKD